MPTIRALRAWLHTHQVLLWSLHSAWALAFGVVVMWLGTRHVTWLRLAFAYVAFIWATSLVAPRLLAAERIPPRVRWLARLAVNYFNKNFYQQLLFFVLPIYAASVTWGAPNMLFVALVAGSAVLSTLDLVYDRYLSARPFLTAGFFAFNLFVCVNVALPILWQISNLQAMRLSAALALLGFVTLRFTPRQWRIREVRSSILLTALLLAFFVEWGRPLVPPAPLRLTSATFGLGLDRERLVVTNPVAAIPRGHRGRVYAVSAIRAPIGLHDRIRHRWVLGTREVWRSPYYTVLGGRTEGFRLWTSIVLPASTDAQSLDLWVETEGGQTVGRGTLVSR